LKKDKTCKKKAINISNLNTRKLYFIFAISMGNGKLANEIFFLWFSFSNAPFCLEQQQNKNSQDD